MSTGEEIVIKARNVLPGDIFISEEPTSPCTITRIERVVGPRDTRVLTLHCKSGPGSTWSGWHCRGDSESVRVQRPEKNVVVLAELTAEEAREFMRVWEPSLENVTAPYSCAGRKFRDGIRAAFLKETT